MSLFLLQNSAPLSPEPNSAQPSRLALSTMASASNAVYTAQAVRGLEPNHDQPESSK